MRKGARRREWTTAEIAFVLENAGTMERRAICRSLRRSKCAVESKVRDLRREGLDVTLRCLRSKLSTCPACGALRSRMGSEGICEPCRRRRQLAKVHGRIARLLAQLSPAERAVYDDTEAETESAFDPPPPPPRLDGLSAYERAKAREAREIEVEDWLSRNLRRQVKAAQKRKERIQKKLK